MNDNNALSLTSPDPDSFKNIVQESIDLALKLGATEAEAGLSVSSGLSVTARMRDVETIEHQQDNGLGISVYFGKHKGTASTSNLDPEAIRKSVEAACDIAKFTSDDPCTGLADRESMATHFENLDLYHPWSIDPESAIKLALECEAVALDYDPRIVNSEGASVDVGVGLSIYGNSHGFLQAEQKSRHGISCSVVAQSEGSMQRDYWYDVHRNPALLANPEEIGRKAAQRTVERLNAQKLTTRQAPVLFSPEMARGLISHYTSAVGGSAQYRKASFLLDFLDQQVFPESFQLYENPYLKQALASANFDSEGITVNSKPLIKDGVVQTYLLDSYAGRKLNRNATGHGSGVHNLTISDTGKSFAGCLSAMNTGLLVTELMGQGVNNVTGDYSRGAAGFWVENGVIEYPVEEITIAANLKDMFMSIVEVGTDVDRRGSIRTGSILIEKMTIAGSD
jgi:PmbA protein